LAHPLRLRILSLLTASAMSAAEAARELGETHANVSYHFRRLHDVGLIDLAEEVAIRGGRARRYRHNPRAGHQIRPHDSTDGARLADALGKELRRRTAHRDGQGPDAMTDAELWIDPTIWQDLLDAVRSIVERLYNAAQPPRSNGTIPVSALLWFFPMRPEPASCGHGSRAVDQTGRGVSPPARRA
jgi:DNA-binding transcriptional ArsR family regulator